MAYVLVDHKVKDYAKWKPVFDKSLPMVKKAGGKSAKLFHITGDNNHVIVFAEWDTKERATAFFTSEDIMKAFKESGVVGAPTVWYLDKIEDVKL